MTKLILLALVVSLNSYAQSSDELTLESKTAPTVIEDETELSATPAEEPIEAPDTVDITENVNPAKDIPAQLPDVSPAELTNKSEAETTVTETPSDEPAAVVEETAETKKAEETPNPTADEIKITEEKPEEKPIDQTPPPAVSTPVITSEAQVDDRFLNHRKSHWISTYSVDSLKYDLPWTFKNGARKHIGRRDQELYGPRVGLGGQLYLGAGFFTTTMVEGYYDGTLFTKEQRANPDVDVKVGSIKRVSGLYGVDVSQSLGHIFEFKAKNPFLDEWAYLTFEPFVEAGLGVAKSYNRVNYYYRTSAHNEAYKATIQDTLTNARIGGGFNMTSRMGFFLQVRATVNRFDIGTRKTKSYTLDDNSGSPVQTPTITDKNAKMDPVTVITIGGGYKF